MSLSLILCSWIQLTERNKIWKFEENRSRKLNDTQSLKTMISSSLFPSSRLISSSKTMILSSEYHYSFEIAHWGNFYHLLCAFSFYCSIFFENMHELNSLLLRKPLSFTMCFLMRFILFPDERIVIEETPIIYYVLSHSISRFSLKTRLRAQLALTGKTPIIYYVLSHHVSQRANCHWGNLYYLMSAFSLNRVIGETSIIYYVLPHSILRRASWKHLYYLLCASSTSALSLRNSLLFCMCFLIVFFGERIAIGKPSIILYVLPHRVLRRAHCHWENLYYLVSASPVIDVRGLTSTLIMIDVKSFLETLRKSLLFSRCFLIIFLDERIEKTSII